MSDRELKRLRTIHDEADMNHQQLFVTAVVICLLVMLGCAALDCRKPPIAPGPSLDGAQDGATIILDSTNYWVKWQGKWEKRRFP